MPSQAGSSFAHGLHHEAPNVSIFQPFVDLTRNAWPPASVAVSSSARRSPTLSSSADAVAVAANSNNSAIRMVLGRTSVSAIHCELIVDPHLDVLGMHGSFVLAVVEEQGGRGVHPCLLALRAVARDLRCEGRVVGVELLHVEAERLRVPGDVLAVVVGRLVEQEVVHLLELALGVRGERGLRSVLAALVLLEREHPEVLDGLALLVLHELL